jgi:hypothetical protein
LSEAKASSQWDGTWDLNSTQADPLFMNIGAFNFTPNSTSPACLMSSTGSYVGALPCATSGSQCIYGGSGNFTIGNTTCNITTTANILLNWFIIDNSTVYDFGSNCTNWSVRSVKNDANYHKI